MERLNRFTHKQKKAISSVLVFVLAVMLFLPYLPPIPDAFAKAKPGDTVIAYGEGFHHYCIDDHTVVSNGAMEAGDIYTYVLPSTGLSEKERAYIFWATLSFQAILGSSAAVNNAVNKINYNASGEGVLPMMPAMTEADLKKVIHVSETKRKYPWLDSAVENAEKYMQMGGIVGASAEPQGGGSVPSVLANSTSLSTAHKITSDSSFTIQFDESGADAGFIAAVPIEFSIDGEHWSPEYNSGWTYVKGANSVQFSNPNPDSPKILIRFNTEGTAYATDGGYKSVEEAYEYALELWVCTECSGTHKAFPKVTPVGMHQRLVFLELESVPVEYYATIGGDPPATVEVETSMEFQIYRHEEDIKSTYNVQLYKYDHETGKPLDGARFDLYERFDDKDQINTEKDGPVHIYAGGEPYASYHTDNPVIWDDFRKVTSLVTDENGRAERTMNRGYHYEKTFCDGHPAPVFTEIPLPILVPALPEAGGEGGGKAFVDCEGEEEGGGDIGDNIIMNGANIELAQSANIAIAEKWINCVSECEAKASGSFEGVHFHWMMDDVDSSIIEDMANEGGNEGEISDAGTTTSTSGEDAYKSSGCQTDCEETYKKFASLKYSYTFQETTAREGYIRHNVHPDDLPVEVITTDSSENGANAVFAGIYDIDINPVEVTYKTAKEVLTDRGEPLTDQEEIPVEEKESLFQRASRYVQKVVSWITGDSEKLVVEEKSEAETEPIEETTATEQTGAAAVPEEESSTKEETEAEIEPIEETTVTEETGAVAVAEEEFTAGTESEAETDQQEESAVMISTSPTPIVSAPLTRRIFRTASASNATPADAVDKKTATASDAMKRFFFSQHSDLPYALSLLEELPEEEGTPTFDPAYDDALTSPSVGDELEKGPSGNYSHCSNTDGEENAWRIYDHRTEGEIHINKRDLELEAREHDGYSSYGDTQGDATLEGAVYGLFAAHDLIHPDGKTGTVYKANNLVSIVATDKNGDASFLTGTEAPGYTYNYETGTIEQTADRWADTAPGNLYTGDTTYDDYTDDNKYIRTYYDNRGNNGNGWIGRPLLMGDYYVKELTRSEGYELSISNRQHDLTNQGQDTDVTIPQGTGYAVVTRNLYAEAQISDNPTGEVGNPDVNELFFSAKSNETGENGFDLVFNALPPDTKFYRKDTGIKTVEPQTGTGIYEKILLTNPDGSPKYITAEHNSQYPKYNPDGSLQIKEVTTDYIAKNIPIVTPTGLEEQKVISIMESAEPAMTKEEVAARLAGEFTTADFDFVKGKLEAALRQNGKNSPSTKLPDSDTREYSSIYVGVYDRGVREGDTDHYGVTGVTPGEPAAYTAYGSPVQTVEVLKTTEAGTPLTTGEAILSLADYYNTHAFYTYGGIDLMEETADSFLFHVYTGVIGNIPDYMVTGTDPEHDSVIYHKASFIPDDPDKAPRLIYAAYSNNPDREAFGTYTDLTVKTVGNRKLANAKLVTDAIADGEGNLQSRMIRQNVYYLKGETVCDKDGTPIQAFEYREILETQEQEVETAVWTEIPAEDRDGRLVAHAESTYTDAFGNAHEDTEEQSYDFRAVVPEKTIELTGEDIEALGTGSGWRVGDLMGGALYYTGVKHAGARAYLDYGNNSITGDNSYVKSVSLIYPKDGYIWQDGDGVPGTGTRVDPVGVQERIIKQKVKVTKDIRTNADGTYDDNTYEIDEVSMLDNFRFKIYLKNNLARLYRDESGAVVWQDRRGNDLTIDADGTLTGYTEPYPALVQDIYTKVVHETAPLYKNPEDAVIANKGLYDFTGDFINEAQNPGYTAILETIRTDAEEGGDIKETYNYDKFFDALAVANQDKWDDGAPTYTSHAPIGNEANRTPEAIENAKASDMVRRFAIDWYLEEEVKKLVREINGTETEDADGSVAYSDELYDKALRQAIIKTENYLKPFFTYDLDAIYAVHWDSAPDGGTDGDKTTLSADQRHEEAGNNGYYYGESEYLPYGTYIIAEQQPRYVDLEDFANRHYRIDQPKEIELPSVYTGYEGSQQNPEAQNPYYRYSAADTPEELSAKYELRFNEERHIIKAQNRDGNFEVYKYGLSIPIIKNGDASAGAGDYFALTQDAYKPYQNYYNVQDDRMTGDVPYYLSEGQSGREAVSKYYRYSSVAESAGLETDTPTMTGIQTAYDGQFAPMLVPWSITEPENETVETEPTATGESSGKGYGYRKFTNTFYTGRLRIEKLDSETHENILHDGAVFNIYKAERNDTPDSDGTVRFYETDTVIQGSREFLTAMKAVNIRSAGNTGDESGILYSGTVPAGTPVCSESGQIFLMDTDGVRTGEFQSFTTTRDGLMQSDQDQAALLYADQNVGYLETPEPLGAGAYVLCEVKPPSGYSRTKPIAIEIYSDRVTYYKNGNRDSRVAAATYEYTEDNRTETATVASVSVENTPIKLTVEKVKESSINTADTTPDKTVTYKVSGRVDGSLAEIGGRKDLEYAYTENGVYLGYGWKKGTLEYLSARKEAGEQIETVYNGKHFAGYGYLPRKLETADDQNKYVAGATMTLFEAMEVKPSGDSGDFAYGGLNITRNGTGNITRMYVEKGHAGERTEFLQEDGVWTTKIVTREDTEILYYDLDSLSITQTGNIDGKDILYGYDRNHKRVPLQQLESDKANYDKTDTEHSIFAFKGGRPYLEFVGGDFTKIEYFPKDKIIKVGEGTTVYHIDRDGNRDSLTDPYTGMAYIRETLTDEDGQQREAVLVWPINTARDESGAVTARDKITTSRIATLGENRDGYADGGVLDVTNHSGTPIPEEDRPSYSHTESGYITGSWASEAGEESHKETTLVTTNGQNRNEEVLVDDNNGSFEKTLNPVFDRFGLAEYYQRSDETYDKGTDLYDRNGDFVRYKDSDNLPAYNRASYRILESGRLPDSISEKLYHRQGESYILENTWVTSDKTPNDPFDTQTTDGQADILKRLPEGTYIMEELKSPDGYLKGLPRGITIGETDKMHRAMMVDTTTKTEFPKTDDTDTRTFNRIDMRNSEKETTGATDEAKGSYGYKPVPGAELALYEAEKVFTADGYYLEKTSDTPVVYRATDHTPSAPVERTARWTTGNTPVYIEGLPEGDYLLEELTTPSGFVTAKPVEVLISNTKEVQTFPMKEDHTKVEVDKFAVAGLDRRKLNGAGFTLYKAVTDAGGNVIFEEGRPKYDETAVIDTWITDDATDFTESIDLSNYPNTDTTSMSGFTGSFEAMYRDNGTKPGTAVSWQVERSAHRSATNNSVWRLEDGSSVIVKDGVPSYPDHVTQENRDGFEAALNANPTDSDTIRWAVTMTAAYVSHTQIDAGNATGGTSVTNFPTSAVMLFQTGDGRDIRISVYQETADSRGTAYTFEYQYDYKKLNSVNDYACSWLTADGQRRFDYLPVKSSYVLVETMVPEGFSKAEDIVITVEDIPDIQYYRIDNEVSALLVSKVIKDGTKELAGAELALYRADRDGNLVQDTAHLVTSWISGNDGRYTEADFINGRIPDGYEPGDLKPHTIPSLADGIYYLAELKSPDYYTLFEPVRIDYKQSEEIRVVRAGDVPAVGELEIIKTDNNGGLLTGAVFEVSAYRDGTREPEFTHEISDTNGRAVLKNLPVGHIREDGQIEPYLYKVKETRSPDGYAVNTLIETFRFMPDNEGDSWKPGETVTISLRIRNEKTRLYIEKRDFDRLDDDQADGIFIEGAELAIYELYGKDENDNYIYDENNPYTSWTTVKNERHMVEGLTAGKSYLLKELKAPTGYQLMKPVVLTVSTDGRKISGITNELNTVAVSYIQVPESMPDIDNPDLDSIESMTITGRYAVRVETVMTDIAGTELHRWVNTGKDHTITPGGTVEDGGVYTFTEHTYYSDGAETISGRETKRIHFEEDGTCLIPGRSAEAVSLALTKASDGTLIKAFTPSEYFNRETIQNNVNPENPAVTIKNRSAAAGDALNPEQVIFTSIFYVNTSNIVTDMEVTAEIDEEAVIIDAGNGIADGNTVKWTIPEVKPGHGGYVSFGADGEGMTAHGLSVTATLKFNGMEKVSTKTVPMLIPNSLTIYNELTGSGNKLYQDQESRFRVRFYSEAGSELKGSYSYDGSTSGTIRSGELLTLAGNEHATIHFGNIYKNVRYEVERIEDGLEEQFTSRNTTGTAAERTGASAVFTRHVTDTTDRELFAKGESYVLTETTVYSDGDISESNKFRFSISETGGVDGIGGYDRQTKVLIEKTDAETGKALDGAELQVLSTEGVILDQWISTGEPRDITGVLEPGETYLLHEASVPDGYGFAEDIRFTVSHEGTIDRIIMEDKQTRVIFSKTDISGTEELIGGHYSIKDKDGKTVYEYTADGKPHEITGLLIAGETYTFVEDLSPIGYAYAESVEFTVSMDGSIDRVTMLDKPTRVVFSKTDISGTEELVGGHYSIKDKDGKVIYEYTADGKPHEVTGLLTAGETYTFVEDLSPIGYAYSESVEFTVSMDGTIDHVMMYDKPTDVIIDKTDIEGVHSIAGATLQLLDSTGAVRKEWVTTGEPIRFLKELTAGETYTLKELQPPDGYAHAEDITFTVSHDGSQDVIIMKDEQTKLRILKINSFTGKPLAGATMQIRTLDQAILEEWITTTEAHEITGILTVGENYLLHEVQPPSGFSMSKDVEFKVPHGAETLEIVFENKPYTPWEPGPETRWLEFKKASEDGTPLAGAEFVFWNADGTKLTSAVSDSRGIIRIKCPPDGTYTYQEIKAPTGHLINPDTYSFTVKNGTLITEPVTVLNYKVPEILIEKLDATDQSWVSGAVIRIWHDSGWATEAVTVEGTFTITAPFAGTFHMQEVQAPEGYQLNQTVYEFTVHEDGSITGTTAIYDYPEGTPTPGEKIGKVTASYQTGLNGRGYSAFGIPGKHVPGAKTGDDTPMMLYAVIWIISMLGLEFLAWKRKNTHICLAAMIIMGGTGLSLTCTMPVLASEVSSTVSSPQEASPKETLSKETWEVLDTTPVLTIQSAPFPASIEPDLPPETYQYRGNQYQLTGYDVVDVPLPSKLQTVTDTIIYEAVEEADKIPQTADITVTDERSGEAFEVSVPLQEYEYYDYRWTDDFEFPIQVEEADAGYYALGNMLVEQKEEAPFSGYEKELLQLLKLSTDAYQIKETYWISEPWADDKGIIYRRALAKGNKRVATVRGIYSGEAELPLVDAKAVKAYYKELPGEKTTELLVEPVQNYENHEAEFKEADESESWLKRIVTQIISVSLLLILALIVLLLSVLFWRKRKEQHERRYKTMKCIFLLLTACAIVSGILLIGAFRSYASGRAEYGSLQEVYESDQIALGKTGQTVHDHLKDINKDYLFWLTIPGTSISYPVVQEQNAGYYLEHTFYRKKALAGSLFVPQDIPALTADNTVIFGHNMKDQSMFGSLKRYREKVYLDEHPLIEIGTEEGTKQYLIFAVYEQNEKEGNPYWFPSEEEKSAYIQRSISSSMHKSLVEPDHISGTLLTLSTCTSTEKRLIVQAYQLPEEVG